MKVHRARVSACGKYRHSPRSSHIVLPLILIGVPVEFAQSARLQGHNRGGDIGGGKVFSVNNLYAPAGAYLGGLHFAGKKCEGIRHRPRTFIHLFLLFRERTRQIAREDKQLVRRHILEGRLGHIEILRQHFLGRMVHPVCQKEGFEFVEVTIVEYEKELTAIGTKALNRVRNSAWEKPEVPSVDVIYKSASMLIDGGDARRSGGHEGPLCANMPMQLANAAFD